MPMRPIDAIFVQPSQQFYVVYHKGELWQMPRLKLDIDSWERKKPYQEAISALYLSKYQYITDPELSKILTTYELPESLHGCNLDKFKNWWQMYGQLWINNPNQYHDEEALASIEELENNSQNKPSSNSKTKQQKSNLKNTAKKKIPSTTPKVSNRPTKSSRKNKIKATKNNPTNIDLFDNLLNKLNNEMYEKKPKKHD